MEKRTVYILAIITSCILVYVQLHNFTERNTIQNIPPFKNQADQEKRQRERVVSVKLIGGLGNQLWLYSSLHGIAKKTGRKPFVCITYDMRQVFSNLSIPFVKDEECKHRSNKTDLRVVQRNSHLYYDIEMITILRESQNPKATICCYLQNLGFFIEYIDDLKAQFTILPKLQEKAQNYLVSLTKIVAHKSNEKLGRNQKGEVLINGELPVFINVHVRRANMLKEVHVIKPGPKYFEKAMNHFRKKYGNRTIFSVASDDPKWCKENINGNDVYFTSDPKMKSREEEFAIAVACNHTVLSVGTFGLWMGILTGGDVIYIRDWVVGNWKPWYNPGQFFPHSWISM